MTVLSPEALAAQGAEARAVYARLAGQGLKLDMTRGKPAPEQLDLAEGMLALPGNRDHLTESGEDARNYGGLQGLVEARRLFGAMLGVPPEAVRTVHGIDYVTVDAADGPLDVAVVLGERYRDAGQPRVEVLTGLADGDKVVLP